MIRYYDEIEKHNCEELDRIIFNSTERQYKDEKIEFFKHHKYVFGILSDREIEIVNLYYGLVDGKCRTCEEISALYGCGRANIARILSDLKLKLRRPIVYKLLSKGYTDEDLGCTYDNLQEFNVETLEKLLKTELRNEEIVKREKYELLSSEDKDAELCLDLVLNKLFYRYFDDCEELLRGLGTKNISVGTILGLNENVINVPYNVDIIREIHSLGLKFKCEEEFEKGWREACLQGIKKYGIDKVMEYFDIKTLSSTPLEEFLKLNVDTLDLTVRSRNVLRYNSLYTIEDIMLLGKEKLKALRNLGELSYNEIITQINNMGQELYPDEFTPDIWITKLREDIDSKKIITQEAMDVTIDEFEELMSKPLEELKFSLRTFNALERSGITTLGDLVNTTEEELNKVRYLCEGKKEIINKIKALGLTFRSEEETRELWLNKLKEKYLGDIVVEEKPEESIKVVSTDLSEFEALPDKYKYLVAIGAGVVAGEGVKEDRTVYSSFKQEIFDEKLEYSFEPQIVDDGDRSLTAWNFLEEDIHNVKYLNDQFIAENREVLRVMVYQNKELSIDEKIELLGVINLVKSLEMIK